MLWVLQPDCLIIAFQKHHWPNLCANSKQARLGVPDPRLVVWPSGRNGPVDIVVMWCNGFPTTFPRHMLPARLCLPFSTCSGRQTLAFYSLLGSVIEP